jgi:hypothetical protein
MTATVPTLPEAADRIRRVRAGESLARVYGTTGTAFPITAALDRFNRDQDAVAAAWLGRTDRDAEIRRLCQQWPGHTLSRCILDLLPTEDGR